MGSISSSRPSCSSALSKDEEMKAEGYKRRAVHAGSWYSNSKEELDTILSNFLADAEETVKARKEGAIGYSVDSIQLRNGVINGDEKNTQIETPNGTNSSHPLTRRKKTPKAVVVPHAGYSYSGETAAYAYIALREAHMSGSIERIVVLHPSHKISLDTCAVSGASFLDTPLGDLTVDVDLRRELLDTGKFSILERRNEENEHSGELQYPFIYKALSGGSIHPEKIPVLPIMVGHLSSSRAESYGNIFAPILARPGVFTIVSSDFCHWGTRFQYAPFDHSKAQQIFQYIQWLDNVGMVHIQKQDPNAFYQYLKETRNTICGRSPISVWLNAVKANRDKNVQALDVQFIRYAQSSNVRSQYESSVSYASAVARLSD